MHQRANSQYLLYVRFFNRAFESSSVWFSFGAVDFVSTWVTLLSAVGLRMCGAASIGRRGLESHAYGRALIYAQRTCTASSRPYRPRGGEAPRPKAGSCYLAPTSLPHWKSEPSNHMRCMMTASLRASATKAFWRPLVFCSRMPQALRADQRWLRESRALAAA